MKKQAESNSDLVLVSFILGLVLIALVEIADEYFDIPSLIFNSPPTPINWSELALEVSLIFIVGLSVGLLLTRLLSRQKKTEAALLDSKEQYRLLQEHASEGIVVIQDGLVKFANPRAARFFARRGGELSSMQFTELIHENDRQIATRRYLGSIKGKQRSPVYCTYRFITKRGKIKWAETTSTEFIWEKKPAFLVFLTDVTGRKKAEESLRKSEERYRTISEDMEKGYYETDLAGNVTFANDSICRVLGYSRKEITGTNYRKYAFDEENIRKMYKHTNIVYKTADRKSVV